MDLHLLRRIRRERAAGRATNNTDSANSGYAVRFAFVGDPVSYLLYSADWFPVVGDGTDRFTAEMHVHVPVGERVLGSGAINQPAGDAAPGCQWPDSI